MTRTRIRPATPADVAALIAFDDEPHVAAASGADDAFDWRAELPRDVSWREIRVAEVDGRIIGVTITIDAAEEESHYWGDVEPGTKAIDIWIGVPEMLGRGHGTDMMRDALTRAFADPATRSVLIDPLASNHRAIRFYERMGFRPIGPRRFGDDDCLVLRIDRADWSGRT